MALDAKTGRVTVAGAVPFHIYTVNFLVYQIWDSTSMYNHLTNHWTCDPIVSTDPYYRGAWDHLMEHFDRWLAGHPHTSLVRLTSLAYHFTLDSRADGADKYRDWTGYTDTISIPALDDFEKEFGYRITSEDIVDQGYYNATYRVPSKAYRDWMAFIQKFVHRYGKTLVDKAHAAGKRTGLFFGDHWAGAEPYSEGYQSMGIDVNIGACEDGVALRRCADTPGNNEKEVRFYPYFFPDVFREGGDPKGESLGLWMQNPPGDAAAASRSHRLRRLPFAGREVPRLHRARGRHLRSIPHDQRAFRQDALLEGPGPRGRADLLGQASLVAPHDWAAPKISAPAGQTS